NGSASILPAINYYSTLPKTPKKPTIPLPFQCDIVFYVDALNPSPPPNISKNDVITTKDMVKTFIFPDGTTATICRMEFFMEESIQRYQFDADALILYQTFKSIEDHQICTGCPHFNRVTECNIWQMNSHGYYLCSTCCLGLQRSKSPHNCHVPYETSKNRFRKRAAKGLCSRCSFYYRPSMKLSYIDMMMKRQPRHRIEHINYSVAEFFEILMFGNARPQFDDWNLEKQIISESPTKEIQKDTVDDSEIECVDIVTIKDTVTLSTSIEKLELTDDDKKLLSNVETEEISDFEELKEWEFAKNSSSDSSCKSIVL
uniref:GATA-type domain-containing protein n=1 Tax=Panagrolaimus sp. ES5 TaxID=591445 RepID=A0AC34GW42_9BILA